MVAINRSTICYLYFEYRIMFRWSLIRPFISNTGSLGSSSMRDWLLRHRCFMNAVNKMDDWPFTRQYICKIIAMASSLHLLEKSIRPDRLLRFVLSRDEIWKGSDESWGMLCCHRILHLRRHSKRIDLDVTQEDRGSGMEGKRGDRPEGDAKGGAEREGD